MTESEKKTEWWRQREAFSRLTLCGAGMCFIVGPAIMLLESFRTLIMGVDPSAVLLTAGGGLIAQGFTALGVDRLMRGGTGVVSSDSSLTQSQASVSVPQSSQSSPLSGSGSDE